VQALEDFGAVGDGATADQAAFNAAISAGGADIHIPAGTYRFSSNVTFPATQTLRFANGALLKPDGGVTVTVNGPVDTPPNQQAFAGAGTVLLPKAGTLSPVWFGAVGDGATDDTAAISATVAALGGSSGVVNIVRGNTHRVASNLAVPANVHLVFDHGAQLKPDTSVTITINGDR